MKLKIQIELPKGKLTNDEAINLLSDLLQEVKDELHFMDDDCLSMKNCFYHTFNPDAKLRSQEDRQNLGFYSIEKHEA